MYTYIVKFITKYKNVCNVLYHTCRLFWNEAAWVIILDTT